MVRKSIRILHLEDNPVDAELVKLELRKIGIAYTITLVETGQEYEKYLRDEEFDLILSDFSLPNYTGTESLAFAAATCPQTPFIFVTGEMGEERAISSLTQGAMDYVMKDRLAKLVPAVRRAMERDEIMREQRATQEELVRSEEHYRKLVEVSLDAILSHKDGKITYANPAALKLFGATSAGDLLFRPIMDFIHPEYHEIVRQRHIRLTVPGCSEPLLEEKLLRLDGTTVYGEVSTISYAENDQLVVQMIIRDLTERKKAEQSLLDSAQRYTSLFQNGLIAFAQCRIITNAEGKPVDWEFIKVNEAYEKIMSVKKEQIEGKTGREVFPNIEHLSVNWIQELGSVALEGRELNMVTLFEPLNRRLSVFVYSPKQGEFTGIFSETDEEKAAE